MTQKNIFSPEPEIAILSILLRFPDMAYSVEGLRFFMFSSTPHQLIYQEIESLSEKQLLPDAHLIISSLESTKNLSKTGGKDYIEYLVKQEFPKENLKEYITFAVASYKARSLLSTISGIKSEELTIDNVDFWVDKLKKSLDGLMENSGGSLTVHVGDGIRAAFDEIVARTSNPGIRGSSWGITDVDLATGGKNPGDLWIIGGRPGSGKCLGKGTKVLMFDGSLKAVENIVAGELVMGVNSKPRTVLSTITGREQMYWVRQNKGIDYRVNKSHIMSLKRSRNDISGRHGELLNISVSEYLAKSNKFKNNHKGYKVSVDYPETNLLLEPYFLGLWLGDGSKASSEITKPDPEIGDYLRYLAEKLGMNLSRHNYDNRCVSYTLIHGKNPGMLEVLKSMNLINNKHIPNEYLINSRKNRLSLLAGLLDTDGYLNSDGTYFEIVQKSEPLAKQIKLLADSLGFRTGIVGKVGTIKSLGFTGNYFRVNIGGNIDEIPTKINRKKANRPVNRVDKTMTGVHLEKDIVDNYYGFELSGDGLFLLEDMTVTHNSALMCNSVLTDGKNGVPCLIFEKEMNYQTLLERLVAIETGIPIQNIRLGLLTQDQIKVISDALAIIKKYPIYIDTSFTSDLYYIESTITRYKSLYGVHNVYLDYLQLLSERDENQTQELGRISRMLKLLANQHSICVLAISQLNRAVEQRDNKRPLMSDLRQSGSLEEDADLVIGLYRDEYYNKESTNKGLLEFIILKARNGPVGTLTLRFTAESNKISKVK